MWHDPDQLTASLRELAESEVSAASQRFEVGLRQAVRWEQARRRVQRRLWVVAGSAVAVLAALAVALALPATARLLPLPVGGELRRLDDQTSDLQAQLNAQAAAEVLLRRRLAGGAVVVEKASRRGARHKTGQRNTATQSWPYDWAWVRPATAPSTAVVASPLAATATSPSPSPSPTPSATPSTSPSPSAGTITPTPGPTSSP
jgi:type II secretory pathway pseudopilin PulG